MKKSLSFFMAIVMALSSLCGITVCGAEMRYAYTISVSSRLSISSQTATCISTGSKWYSVTDEPWSASANNYTLTVSNSKSSLSSGTYRLRTVFTVYSGSDSETIEKISKEVTI